jgi:hypothetical protein
MTIEHPSFIDHVLIKTSSYSSGISQPRLMTPFRGPIRYGRLFFSTLDLIFLRPHWQKYWPQHVLGSYGYMSISILHFMDPLDPSQLLIYYVLYWLVVWNM